MAERPLKRQRTTEDPDWVEVVSSQKTTALSGPDHLLSLFGLLSSANHPALVKILRHMCGKPGSRVHSLHRIHCLVKDKDSSLHTFRDISEAPSTDIIQDIPSTWHLQQLGSQSAARRSCLVRIVRSAHVTDTQAKILDPFLQLLGFSLNSEFVEEGQCFTSEWSGNDIHTPLNDKAEKNTVEVRVVKVFQGHRLHPALHTTTQSVETAKWLVELRAQAKQSNVSTVDSLLVSFAQSLQEFVQFHKVSPTTGGVAVQPVKKEQ